VRTPADVAAALALTPDTIAVRLAAIDLSEADRAVLREAATGAAGIREAFLDELYVRLRAFPDTAGLLASDAQVARLKAGQRDYLDQLFTAPLDWDYVLRRLWVGVVHHQVRLSPQWYLTTYAHVIGEHLPVLFAAAPPPVALAQAIALIKSAFFDASLGLDAYGRDADAERREHTSAEPVSTAVGEVRSVASRTDAAPPSPLRLRLDEGGADVRRRYLGIDDDVIGHLRDWAPVVAARTPAVLDEFYQFLGERPDTASLVPPEVAVRLKQQVASYWRELVAGTFDNAFAASRMRIGIIHERIGLEPSWYLAGLARQVVGFVRGLDAAHPATPARLQALVRAVCFDLSFVIDAYMDARADRLLQIEGYARQLVAGLASAVAIVDGHDRLVSANRTMVQVAGGEAAVLYMLPLDRALPMPAAAELVRALRQRMASGGGTRLTADARHGGRRLRLTAVALSGERGLEGAIALVVDDVTDLVRLAGDIGVEHSHLEDVADGLAVVLWEMDPATWTITAVNRAALDVTGWRDVAFLGMPSAWHERVAAADRARVGEWLRTLAAGAPASTLDYRWPGADGQERWLRTRARLQDRDGVRRLLGVTTDVTAERQRDQLRLDALRTTAGGVAHVVNNCLTAVIGGIELHGLYAGGLARSPELEAALEATRNAATMASRLLSFAGRQRLDLETLAPGDVVHERLPRLVAMAGARTVTLDVAGGSWRCRVDRRLLGSVIEALVQNACDATTDEGTIRIATRDVPAHAVPGDADARGADWVEVEVADTGVGMADEVRRRAVEPFFSTRDLADASGLGLSMVHGFVAQSGGHVRLDSAPGRGTTVRLRFPRAGAALPVADRHTLQVLVVEDDENVRVVTAAMVRALGHRVLQAASAADALAVAATDRVDVLVSDVVLGHAVDGVGLALALLERRPSLAVVLVSGFPQSSFDLQALPQHVVFLPKPLGMAALGGAIRAARREDA